MTLSLMEARGTLQKAVSPLPPRRLPVADALGLRLASPVPSLVDLPAHDLALVDGYAVRRSSLGPRGSIQVLENMPPELAAGAAVRVRAGNPLPPGADAVVPEDAVIMEPGLRIVVEKPPAQTFVRRRGDVLRQGGQAADPGWVVTPALQALIHLSGAEQVEAIPRPRVILLSSDSAQTDHEAEGVRALLRAGLRELALESQERELESITAEDLGAGDAHVTVTAGFAPDSVLEALSSPGAETVVDGMRAAPGSDVLVARDGDRWIVAVPTGLADAMIAWERLVRPMLRQLGGDHTAFADRRLEARLALPAENHGRRPLLVPVRLEEGATGHKAMPLGTTDVPDAASLARADALLYLLSGQHLKAGEEVFLWDLRR